ncbi:hypothetical protein [Fusobacterium sp.]|uniref:hypothetical protein n=1 Tax=Fusobacterium sp. TaxID=68766 RepID=UPI00396C8378
MKYKKKTKGFSTFEILIYTTLVAIFSTVLFPIVKSTTKIYSTINNQTFKDRNEKAIIELIEKAINEAGGPHNFNGSKNMKHSAQVFNYNNFLPRFLEKSFFEKKSSYGNTLFLETYRTDGKKMIKHFLVFYFYNHTLNLYEGELVLNGIAKTFESAILENVEGGFIQTDTGIFITIEVIDRDSNQRRIFKGYENFSYNIKK